MVYFGIFCFVLSFFMLVICDWVVEGFWGMADSYCCRYFLVGIFIVITAGALYPEEF